jgi:hypothetical protein
MSFPPSLLWRMSAFEKKEDLSKRKKVPLLSIPQEAK